MEGVLNRDKVPYLGPVEQVLSRPNSRVLDIATVRTCTPVLSELTRRVPGCKIARARSLNTH